MVMYLGFGAYLLFLVSILLWPEGWKRMGQRLVRWGERLQRKARGR